MHSGPLDRILARVHSQAATVREKELWLVGTKSQGYIYIYEPKCSAGTLGSWEILIIILRLLRLPRQM